MSQCDLIKNESTNAEFDQDCWSTPGWLVEALCCVSQCEEVLLDGCASKHNRRAKHFINESQDTLTVNWANLADDIDIEPSPTVFLNPPYSNPRPFVQHAIRQASKGCTVIMLLKSDTSTSWWVDIELSKVFSLHIPIVGRRVPHVHPVTGDKVGNGSTFASVGVVIQRLPYKMSPTRRPLILTKSTAQWSLFGDHTVMHIDELQRRFDNRRESWSYRRDEVAI